jgi:hypothetical protein
MGLGDGDQPDVVGLRPARPAAFAIRSRTRASRSGMSSNTLTWTGLTWALKPAQPAYFFSCAIIPSPASRTDHRRELHVAFELGDGFRQLAFVEQRHAELIVRVGVSSRFALSVSSNFDLGVGDLALVPEDDALVEVASAPPAAAGRAAFALMAAASSKRFWLL